MDNVKNNSPVQPALQPEVAEKYNLVGVKVGRFQFSGFGTINLPDVDLAHADALVAGGFTHFEPKKKESAQPPEAKAKVVTSGTGASAPPALNG